VGVKRQVSGNAHNINGPAVVLDPENPFKSDLAQTILGAVIERLSIVGSLDDRLFDDEYGELGLWKPSDFASKIQYDFFALEEPDPAKTVALFVHGVGGTPRSFKYFVEALNRKQFQPWFYYYPSLSPLNHTGWALVDALRDYQGGLSQWPRVIVVAHSMGGGLLRCLL